MKARPAVRFGAALTVVLITACAVQPTAPMPRNDCEEFYGELDQRVAAAGVADAGEFRIDGFPYLRVNRFLASFDVPFNGPAIIAWMRGMAVLDVNARRAELRNLAPAAEAKVLHERVRACSARLLARDLASPERREQLAAAVRIPSGYSELQRTLGLYPLVSPLIRRSILDDHAVVLADYQQPVEQLVSPGALLRWQPRRAPPVKDSRIARWTRQRDPLGIPQFEPQEWQRIAERHAPVWWLETGSGADVPGAPQWTPDGIGVDTRTPVVYYKPGFARWQGRIVPQISYHLWFSARPPVGPLDPYAGKLDGLIWRVTLNEQGGAMVYDTIHPCGCYHMYFPVAPLAVREVGEDTEPPLIPQRDVPADDIALRVQAGTHSIRRVVPSSQAIGTSFVYSLRPYDELLSLPLPGGGRRSLFGENGLVKCTQRGERFWLWPSGVISPGAMRQWGHHATAFVGKRYFDAPGDLEQVFLPFP